MRTLEWVDDHIDVVDQTALPQWRRVRLETVDDVVGADRVAANLDVVNKVGTYGLALAAARAGIPFVVAAPESTLDTTTPNGAAVDVEQRDGDEVLQVGQQRFAPPASTALNPAFDVTPADLVTAVVTETRVLQPGLSG